MDELAESLREIVNELDRLPRDHPQWPNSPMRNRAVAILDKYDNDDIGCDPIQGWDY